MSEKRSNQSDFTDAVLAERAAHDALIGRFYYTDALGWLQWDGKRWARCSEVKPIEAIRLWAISKFEEALGLVRTGQADETLIKKCLQPLNKGRISAVVTLARGIIGVTADAKDFDTHRDLLNVANGVVDLQTGALTSHDPALKITKLAPVAYREGATHPDWTATLEAVPADVLKWYQVRCGQAATGHMTPDKKMIVQHGGGDNGKSTLSGAIMTTLGDYAVLVSDKVILAAPDAHTCEKMELRGARYAVIEETPQARRLSVERLKKTVGTPYMEARYMHQNPVRWKSSHSLFLNTNYQPIVEETDDGTWTRLDLMKYPYRFRGSNAPCVRDTDRPGDPGLLARLSGDPGPAHEAALAWLVAGAVCWYAAKRVLPMLPKRIVDDTRAWRKESDLVLAYLDEGHLIFNKDQHVMSTDLLASFNAWLDKHGHRPWSDKLLASRFGEHEQVMEHRVTKKKVKFTPALSQRPTTWPKGFAEALHEVPAAYMAWVGLAYAEEAVPAEEAVNANRRAQTSATSQNGA